MGWDLRLRTRRRPSRRSSLLVSVLAVATTAHLVVVLASPAPQAGGQVIDVPDGGNLQQALNAVQPGGTVRLAPGATYLGSFTLPAKNGSEYILITTADAVLPAPGTRIDPGYKPRLATIRSSSTSSALITAPGASYYRIVGVAFEANRNGAGDIIALGHADQTTLAAVPHHIEFDRVLISGDPVVGQKRAIAANAAHVTIANSDIREIKAAGQDSQAIASWNSPGPFVIRNNHLEAAGENIMFGGAHISIPGVIPSDITVEDNLLTKNPAWKGMSWTVKNLFELKNARRVVVRRNIMQFTWGGAQSGFAIVLTPRNSSGQTPWVVVSDVEFSGNVVAHSGSGFNLLGHDDTDISGQLARVVIKDNLVFDITGSTWEGAGTFAQIGGEPAAISFDHNTIMHSGNIVTFYSGNYLNGSGVRVNGGPVTGFVFMNNLLHHNAYGIFGSGQGYGNQSLAYYAPGAVVQRNVMASDASPASRYPSDNQFPSLASFHANFSNPAAQDYRLVPGSPYTGAGTDGKNIGCDFATLYAAVPSSAPPSGLRVISLTR
jgi:hypothetical protein